MDFTRVKNIICVDSKCPVVQNEFESKIKKKKKKKIVICSYMLGNLCSLRITVI